MRFIAGIIMLIVLTKKNPPAQSNYITPIVNGFQPTPNGVVNPSISASSPALTTQVQSATAPATVDPDYLTTEKQIIQNAIEREIVANGYKVNEITTRGMLGRKLLNAFLFSVITFICLSLYFFHFPTWTYLLEIIVIIVFIKSNSKYSTKDYLAKEVKARPDEKISNIVASILAENVKDTLFTKLIRIAVVILPFVLVLFVYSEPHFLYEKASDGYHLRFYTQTLSGEDEITVPDEYKGEPITGIRGNVFSNLRKVRKITLPDTIKEIRGKTFKNDTFLEEVNLPAELTYLGGSAFANCEYLEEITIPEGVTEIQGRTFYNCRSLKVVNLHDKIEAIHGEAFINCQSLETIELPPKITEIRGNTFQGCSSLETVVIPEGVTRIGGHAFEDCSSLKDVTFPKTLREIGSSAFRRCYALKEVRIPYGVTVADNAFKENNYTRVYYFTEGSPSGTEYENFRQLTLFSDHSTTVFGNTDTYYLEITNVKKIDSTDYEYTIKVSNETFNKEVTVSKYDLTKKINKDLEIEVVEDSYNSMYSVKLNVYFN